MIKRLYRGCSDNEATASKIFSICYDQFISNPQKSPQSSEGPKTYHLYFMAKMIMFHFILLPL